MGILARIPTSLMFVTALLLQGGSSSASSARNCSSMDLTEISKRYKDLKLVGSGATGCVYIGTAGNGGSTVAVKTSKFPGRLKAWREECRLMQTLHTAACAAGKEQLKEMENYVPTCLEISGTDENPFLVMHATGTTEMLQYKTVAKTEEDNLSIFGQMVAAIYSLHNVGWTHNDLHFKNIMLEDMGEDNPHIHVALIDFGEIKVPEVRPQAPAWASGYKRDAFAIWRASGNLANCPGAASLAAPQHTMEKTQLLECLKGNKAWKDKGADEDFFKIFELLIDDTIAGAKNQHVKELYETSFIQGLLPPLKQHYKFLDPDTCTNPGLVPSAKPSPRGGGTPVVLQATAKGADLPISTLGDRSDCKGLCAVCPPDSTSMYACHTGLAIRQCNEDKNFWLAADCSGICDCKSSKHALSEDAPSEDADSLLIV